MSTSASDPNPRLPAWVWGIGVLLIGSIFALLIVASMRPDSKGKVSKDGPTELAENNILLAKASLDGQRDLGSCRQAINHLNKDRMSRAEEIQKLPIPEELLKILPAKQKDYLKSVTSPGMDAWYIEECLFFREIVNAGEFQIKTKDYNSSIKAASDLWDWVMREVALHDSPMESSIKPPLHWILRRGTGTPEERARIFLAMLRHSGMHDTTGCLIRFSSSDSPFQLLVAVRTPDGKPHLFDPVIGLPLEKMIGTHFGKVIIGDWPISLWTSKSADRIETQRHWNGASFGITVPLPALAPRNKDLSLLVPGDTSAIPEIEPGKEIDNWKATLKTAGILEPKVSLDSGSLLRWPSFLPGTEGGEGNPGLAQLFSLSYVPWELLPREILEAHPLLARLPVPLALGVPLPQPVGEKLMFGVFAPIFKNWHETADKGRDLLIRFQFSKLVPQLKQEKEEIQGRVGQIFNDAEKSFIKSWINDANSAYANLARNHGNPLVEEQVKALWERSGPMMMTVLIPAANARIEEIQIALALAKHEQASQMERRLIKKIPGTTLIDSTRAWRSAAEGWAQLASDGKTPAGALAHVARFHGEALWKSGNPTKARETWSRHAGSNSPDARACAILARSN